MKLILLRVALVWVCGAMGARAQTFPDDFNDNVVNTNHWGLFDEEFGNAFLNEQSFRANYLVPAATAPPGIDSSRRSWAPELPVNANWEATLQVHNTDVPAGAAYEYSALGLNLARPGGITENVFIEFFTETASGGGANRGFYTTLRGDQIFGDELVDLPVTDGMIKLAYNAATKVVTASYDRDGTASAFGWQVFGTFGLGGSGGNSANRNWALSPTNVFTLSIYGYSEDAVVGNGQIWADNFALTIGAGVFPDTYPDNFNDNVVDATKWAADINDGNGRLFEQNQRVDYLAATPDEVYDFPVRPWVGPLPIDVDWEAMVDAHNSFPSTGTQWLSIGLQLVRPGTGSESIFFELIAQGTGGGISRGFFTTLETNRQILIDNFADIPLTDGSLKMSFTAASGILSMSYDRDGAGAGFGYQLLGSYGLKGVGGSLATREWNLLPTQRFTLRLYAYSEEATVSPGQAWLDNFRLNLASAAAAPLLTITREATNVRLKWPAAATGYTIQASPSLNPAVWGNITTPTAPTGANFEAVVPIGAGHQFFRLIK